MKVKQINIYPIKGLAGIELEICKAMKMGFKNDRRLMLVDAKGVFISQRSMPALATIQCQLIRQSLIVSLGSKTLEIPLDTAFNKKIDATIWDDNLETFVYEAPINNWFSDILNQEVQLVYSDDLNHRIKQLHMAPGSSSVSFADGYPYLALGDASMEFLNKKLSEKIYIDRFRANIVIGTEDPHIEDQFADIQIGQARFKNIKPCKRCIVTTIDQETGKKGAEPLKTLSTYRKFNNHIYFGTNMICMQEGSVKVGDKVKILTL